MVLPSPVLLNEAVRTTAIIFFLTFGEFYCYPYTGGLTLTIFIVWRSSMIFSGVFYTWSQATKRKLVDTSGSYKYLFIHLRYLAFCHSHVFVISINAAK